MSPPTPWNKALYALLPHPHEPRLWLLPSEQGWALPYAAPVEPFWLAQVAPVNRAFREAHGLDVHTLRYLTLATDEAARHVELGYVLDGAGDPPLPEGRWVALADLDRLTLADPHHRPFIRQWLEEQASGDEPPLRSPWARRGWFARASAWMVATLVQRGYALVGPVEQFRSWGISCVLRVPTDRGDVYFKVATKNALFGDEPALTQALAARFPEHVPLPLATEPEERWMLLADFGKELRGNGEPAQWAEMLSLYGRLQRATVTEVEALRAAGCLDRRLPQLAAQIESLLAAPDFLAHFEPDERERLAALAPRLLAMVERLERYGVPPALVHGDFHPGNIAAQPGRYLFFDWTDACIAHPFFDLITLQDEARALPDGEALWARLLDDYLALWSDYEPVERLREAWTLARPLSILHQIVSYQEIVRGQEASAQNEYIGGVVGWTRELLSSLEDA